MKLDLNSYRTSLDKMLPQILDHKGRKHDRCSELSAVSGIPVLAMVLYALRPEVLGPSEELEKVALDLKAFYKYDEIKDWKEG